MTKRILMGPFSVSGEQEVGAERRGCGVRWFIMGQMATKDMRGGRKGAAICHGLLSPPLKVEAETSDSYLAFPSLQHRSILPTAYLIQ